MNRNEAIKKSLIDEKEGADVLMIKLAVLILILFVISVRELNYH